MKASSIDLNPNPIFGDVIGEKVERILVSERCLLLVLHGGKEVGFEVQGGCCSDSFLQDIYGVENLKHLPILAVETVDLEPGDLGYHGDTRPGWNGEPCAECGKWHDHLQVYGFRFAMNHPLWGTVSAVMSFRNDSNGYYGGWMERTYCLDEQMIELFADCADIPNLMQEAENK